MSTYMGHWPACVAFSDSSNLYLLFTVCLSYYYFEDTLNEDIYGFTMSIHMQKLGCACG